MRRFLVITSLFAAGCDTGSVTRVGSKDDSESVLLAECAAALVRDTGREATTRRGLGGTAVVWKALLAGEIDIYPEFTGTLAFGILHDPSLTDLDRLRTTLDAEGIGMTAPLGYENNYAIAVRPAEAVRLNLDKLSDLARHPDLKLGLSSEFTRRADGWPALARLYGLTGREVLPLEHRIAYDALTAGKVDAVDVYTTDAEIARDGLAVLPDDKHFFPSYAALYVYRQDWARTHPEALKSIERLAGKLDAATIRSANVQTLARVPETQTAAELLKSELGVEAESAEVSRGELLWRYTLEHLTLVASSLSAAVVVAIPLGVLAARRPRLGQFVIGTCGLIQTVPSLALLVILVSVPVVGGLGPRPAILALFLYSLLPIVRNTATGLTDITPSLRESAAGLGLSRWATLWRVELPLASRSILGGIKTAAVINVGTATLGALIGAGGLGVPIQQGLRTSDTPWILMGALPAAGLAVVVQVLFELAERRLVPKGLRLGR